MVAVAMMYAEVVRSHTPLTPGFNYDGAVEDRRRSVLKPMVQGAWPALASTRNAKYPHSMLHSAKVYPEAVCNGLLCESLAEVHIFNRHLTAFPQGRERCASLLVRTLLRHSN